MTDRHTRPEMGNLGQLAQMAAFGGGMVLTAEPRPGLEWAGPLLLAGLALHWAWHIGRVRGWDEGRAAEAHMQSVVIPAAAERREAQERRDRADNALWRYRQALGRPGSAAAEGRDAEQDQ